MFQNLLHQIYIGSKASSFLTSYSLYIRNLFTNDAYFIISEYILHRYHKIDINLHYLLRKYYLEMQVVQNTINKKASQYQ